MNIGLLEYNENSDIYIHEYNALYIACHQFLVNYANSFDFVTDTHTSDEELEQVFRLNVSDDLNIIHTNHCCTKTCGRNENFSAVFQFANDIILYQRRCVDTIGVIDYAQCYALNVEQPH